MDGKCMEWGWKALSMLQGKGITEVIDIGSLNVNGTFRHMVQELIAPTKYLGIDIEMGPDVDVVGNMYDVVEEHPGPWSLVLSTEALEHIEFWQKAISNMKEITKPGGYILITTRAPGFGKHNYPSDYWRYDHAFMMSAFSDMEILMCEEDRNSQGIIVLARKPEDWTPCDLSALKPEPVV